MDAKLQTMKKQLENQFQVFISSPKKPIVDIELPKWNKDLLDIVSEPFTDEYLEANGIKLEKATDTQNFTIIEDDNETIDESQLQEFIQQNKEIELQNEAASILSSPLEFLRKAKQILLMEQENENMEENLQLLEDEFLSMFID